jgi:hypothetical protein
MKVEDPSLTASSVSSGRAQPPAAVSPGGGAHINGPQRPDSVDRVELSGFTGKLGATLATQSQARTQRVAALARDFQSGRLTVNADATSRSLVSETLSATGDEKAGQGQK